MFRGGETSVLPRRPSGNLVFPVGVRTDPSVPQVGSPLPREGTPGRRDPFPGPFRPSSVPPRAGDPGGGEKDLRFQSRGVGRRGLWGSYLRLPPKPLV